MSKVSVSCCFVIRIAMRSGASTTPSESTNASPSYVPSGIVAIFARICCPARRLSSTTASSTTSAAIAVEKRCESPLADRQRRGLRLDVADPLVGDADVREDDREDLRVEPARFEELYRRQPQALLLDLGRVRGEAAGDDAADVGPVTGIGEPAPELPAIEERLDELDVHQVRPAEIRIVQDEDVAVIERDSLLAYPIDHRLRRELHRAHEHRQTELTLCDQLARIAVIDAVGAVERLRDHRAERRAHEREIHLVAHLLQAALDHRQRDRVDPGDGCVARVHLG